jgi:hypothetical protein
MNDFGKAILTVEEFVKIIPPREQKAAEVEVGCNTIKWHCEDCGEDTQDGFIWSPYRPKPFQVWHIHCRKCDPEINEEMPEASYSFDVGGCSTLGELLYWQAHLSEKNDFNWQNWAYFIVNISRAKDSP